MSTDKVNLSTANRAMAQFQQSKQIQEQPKASLRSVETPGDLPATSPQVEDQFVRSAAADSYESTTQLIQAGANAIEGLPDVRQERIDEVRQKMLDGEIITPEVREQVSKNLEQVMEILDLFVE